ncbi:DUF1631 family protein [Paucibacter sp. APW11]|uniref:DUF1631 family protein n=1 Tax=Roseateles aquae TaxID=3077235 RepID=A0ABU3PH36_9BURK|nr:DUF1631 family protein [Paucibacter sp. APW11]MDT9001417.1 DUF1631 family protein [Paucibacter sp. APW11]
MNAPENRLNPHLEAALQRVRTAAEQASERTTEGLGLAALSAGQAKRRDELLAAQFLFRQQQAQFAQTLQKSLRSQMAGELQAQAKPVAAAGGKKDWGELSLMDDDQVDAMVVADRIGLAIGHQSEWELREVESFVASLVTAGDAEPRNPLRPELIAQALLDAVHGLTEDSQLRQLLIDELTRALATEMRAAYADIAQLLRSRGLKPQDLRVRATAAAGGGVGGAANMTGIGGGGGAGIDMHSRPQAFDGHSRPGELGGYGYPPAGAYATSAWAAGGAMAYGAPAMGVVDPKMMDLLRRLAHLPPAPIAGYTGAAPSSFGALSGAGNSGWDETLGDAGWTPGMLPPNLIHAHRDELRQAATGTLDHMVIDVVAGLFDQILADPKVPPQMARLLARLQLPVLRAALGDPSFFSTRRHPVRRFINRLASLACAYEDFSEDPGREFLSHVRELVQDLANGDFDRIEAYEQKLDALEAFIQAQTAQTLKAHGDAAALVERKEIDLRLQQRYAQQLGQALADVAMPGFLRDFLAQVWSQAIVLASRLPDADGQREAKFRQSARNLVLSVQPKAPGAQRQAFLSALPELMRSLNEGLNLIAWPESARQQFFSQLMPAHADSLKGQGLSPLDYNLLAKSLDGVFGCEAPSEQDLPPPSAMLDPASLPELTDVVEPLQGLTPAEAKSLGLVSESAVDWNGELDIDLSADAPLEAVDISIDGLPPASEAPEPSSGTLLIEHLQLGFAYQMHTGDDWQKVRLAHISAGRSFFIFTQGQKHQQTVTMTARMLKKLCEAGRLRAFENAYLLERATARARKQLAALNSRH